MRRGESLGRGPEAALIGDWVAAFQPPDAGVSIGVGDDAAALVPSPGTLLVATTDALVEGVHFDRRWFAASAVGHKALAVNLSDLAAMGARPRFLLVSLEIPGTLPARFIRDMARGMARLARAEGVSLVGGNVSSSALLSLHLTLLGEARSQELIRRSGARPGDSVLVTGTLGESAMGLRRLRRRDRPPRHPTLLEQRQLRPSARTDFGRRVGVAKLASAGMDLSDGLAADLPRLLEASKVGARIELDRLPGSRALDTALKNVVDPYLPKLSGGEDYELVLTAPPAALEALFGIAAACKLPLTEIGKIEALPRRALRSTPGAGSTHGLRYLDARGEPYTPSRGGYQHHAANFR